MPPSGEVGPTVNWYDRAGDHLADLGMYTENWTNRAVVAAALKHGITVTKRMPRESLILNLGGKKHWFRDGMSSMNSRLVIRISKNKDVLSALLRANGVPALRNQVFAPHEADRAWRWASWFHGSVLKPVDATGGQSVFVNIRTEEEFSKAFHAVAEDSGRVLVEEFKEGTEYRFFAVKGKVIAVAERRPAQVVGDGRKSIQRLINEKNAARWSAPSHKHLKVGTQEQALLTEQGLGPRSVPAPGQVVKLRLTSNLHTGGDAVDVTNTIAPVYLELVEQATKALPGGGVLGLDVLIPSDGSERIGIIEINTGPMVSMHHLPWQGEPRNVAEAVVQAMFPAIAEERDREDWVEEHADSARGSSAVRRPSAMVRLRQRASRALRGE